MNKEDLKERLTGAWQNTLTGHIPADSISLDNLVDILYDVIGGDGAAVVDGEPYLAKNGRWMLNGRFLSSEKVQEMGLK